MGNMINAIVTFDTNGVTVTTLLLILYQFIYHETNPISQLALYAFCKVGYRHYNYHSSRGK